MTIPDDVTREVQALKEEIDRLMSGPWNQAANTNGSKPLRARAKAVELAAKKVSEMVRIHTHSYP